MAFSEKNLNSMDTIEKIFHHYPNSKELDMRNLKNSDIEARPSMYSGIKKLSTLNIVFTLWILGEKSEYPVGIKMWLPGVDFTISRLSYPQDESYVNRVINTTIEGFFLR